MGMKSKVLLLNLHTSTFYLFFYSCYLSELLFQLGAIVLNFGVLISSIYEGIYARRGGDPTKIRDVIDVRSTTINNPGYRENSTNGMIQIIIY